MCYGWTKCSSAEGTTICSGRCQNVHGHHTTNLLDILKADMKQREMKVRNINDLELLRSAAADTAVERKGNED